MKIIEIKNKIIEIIPCFFKIDDIFISYCREDKEKVEKFVDALRPFKWKIWFDKDIIPGHRFEEEILNKLKRVKCVIVVWSKHSTKSEWVIEEAEEGKRRNILVPIKIDDISIPEGFKDIHTTDLAGWPDHNNHQGYNLLIDTIKTMIENYGSVVCKYIRKIKFFIIPFLLILLYLFLRINCSSPIVKIYEKNYTLKENQSIYIPNIKEKCCTLQIKKMINFKEVNIKYIDNFDEVTNDYLILDKVWSKECVSDSINYKYDFTLIKDNNNTLILHIVGFKYLELNFIEKFLCNLKTIFY